MQGCSIGAVPLNERICIHMAPSAKQSQRKGMLRTELRRSFRCHAANVDATGRSPQSLDAPWPPFLLQLAAAGATCGPLLDGIHSKDALQVYDLAAVSLGSLNTSWVVPPLLATFYAVLGALQIAADKYTAADAATQAAWRRLNWGYVALNTGAVAASLQLSAYMHAHEVAPARIFAILAAVTLANWAAFDRTRQGVALAVLCAVSAPVSEVLLNSLFGLWHYPRADLPGLVSWVPWCYAFYTPGVSNLARMLWLTGAER